METLTQIVGCFMVTVGVTGLGLFLVAMGMKIAYELRQK